jgi:YbbR domain-containing protein
VIDNLGSAIFALILAVVVWMVAVYEENPPREDYFPSLIPVEVVGLRPGRVIVSQSADRARIRLRAPQPSWENLREESFEATIEVQDLDPGLSEVEVIIKSADPAVTILEVDPDKIAVRLGELGEETFEVQAAVLDNPPLGYEADSPAVTPEAITVSGPKSLIDQIDGIYVDVLLRGAKTSVEFEVAPTARDAQDDEIQGLTFDPSTVQVEVPIEQRLGYKDVSVRAVTTGTMASGYWISNVSVSPSSVTVVGNPSALAEIPGYLETAPVDVNGLSDTVTERVSLNLPEQVSVLNGQGILVKIEVMAIMGGKTIQQEPTFQGLSINLEAVASPGTVDVILSGPLPVLQKLDSEDVQVVLDLVNLGIGTYMIEPTAIVPSSLEVKSIVPDRVEVEIERSRR